MFQPPAAQSQEKDIEKKEEIGPDSDVSCHGNNIKYYL